MPPGPIFFVLISEVMKHSTLVKPMTWIFHVVKFLKWYHPSIIIHDTISYIYGKLEINCAFFFPISRLLGLTKMAC